MESALDDSLKQLGTDYLDLYIIHWCVISRFIEFCLTTSRPIAFKKDGQNIYDADLSDNPYPTWKKLEEMVDKGKVRNIGISKCVDPVPKCYVTNYSLPVASTSRGIIHYDEYSTKLICD